MYEFGVFSVYQKGTYIILPLTLSSLGLNKKQKTCTLRALTERPLLKVFGMDCFC